MTLNPTGLHDVIQGLLYHCPGQEIITSQRTNGFWDPLCLLFNWVPRALSAAVKEPGREIHHSSALPLNLHFVKSDVVRQIPHSTLQSLSY
jgi:hypothetical protein